jgi:polyhydroxybutyrate depolymerase
MNAKSQTVRWLGVGFACGLALTEMACTGNPGTTGGGGSSTGTAGSGTAGAGTTGTGTGGAGGATGGSTTGTGGVAGTGTGKGGSGGTGGATGGGGGTGGSAAGGTGGSGTAGTGGAGTGGGGTGGGGTGGGGTGGSAGADAGAPRPDASVDSGTPRPDAPPPPNDVAPPPTDAPSSGCGKATTPGSGNFSIDVGGTMRDYIVKIPTSYDTNRPYRLVFAWHGLGGTAQQIAQFGYYQLESPSAGSAIFVSGQGLATTGGAGWPNTGGQDVNFVRALVDWMKTNYCVDQARIFSVGMSYGGIMSNTLGCQMGGIFRAIAPMAGSGPFQFGASACVGQVAAWLTHGTADTVVGYDAGVGSKETWRTRNHCQGTSQATTPSPCVAYDGCDPGFPVHWCSWDGGHTIPTFSAGAIWNFFAQF